MSMDQAYDLVKQREYARALPLLLAEYKKGNFNYNSVYLIGLAYRFLDEFENAETFLVKSISLKNDQPPVYLALGIVYQLTGRYSLALETFNQAIEIDENYDLGYNSIAYTYEKMGQLEDAELFYRKAIRALFIILIKKAENIKVDDEMFHEKPRGELWMDLLVDIMRDRFFKTVIIDGEKILQASSELGIWLPKFFSVLKDEKGYVIYLRNRAQVLTKLGRIKEAESLKLEAEAIDFI